MSEVTDVMIVGDDLTDVRGLARLIQGDHLRVVVTADPGAAGPLAGRHHPAVCVVDLRRPEERRHTAREVRRSSGATTVVAYVDGSVDGRVVDVGATGPAVLIPRGSPATRLAAVVAPLLALPDNDRRPSDRQAVGADALDALDEATREAVSRSPLFALLPPDQIAEVVDVAEVRTYRSGRTLVGQGRRSKGLVVVVSGQAKESHLTPDGHEVILSVLGPGDVVGLEAVLSDDPALTTVATVEPVRGLVLRPEELRQLRRTSPAVVGAFAHAAAVLLHRRTAEAIEWATADIKRRVAHRIVDLTDRFGQATDGVVEVPLPLTQQGLASWAGISREAVVRELADLREAGLIRTGRCRITVVDLHGLRARAGISPSNDWSRSNGARTRGVPTEVSGSPLRA